MSVETGKPWLDQRKHEIYLDAARPPLPHAQNRKCALRTSEQTCRSTQPLRAYMHKVRPIQSRGPLSNSVMMPLLSCRVCIHRESDSEFSVLMTVAGRISPCIESSSIANGYTYIFSRASSHHAPCQCCESRRSYSLQSRGARSAHFLNVAVLPGLSECIRLAGLGAPSAFILAA